MGLVQRTNYSTAASGLVANVLTATAIEWIGKASIIDIYGSAFLAAANDTVAMTYTVGGDSRVIIPAGSGLNVNPSGPQVAFDGLVSDYALPLGSHLILSLTADATAGTHTGRFMFNIRP